MRGIQTIIKQYKGTLAVILVALISILSIYILVSNHQKEKTVLLTQEQAKSQVELSKKTHITEQEAQEVIHKVENSQPTVTYYVQSPTVQAAAEQTQKAIKNNDEALPKVATEKSDRTAVVANEEKQKVDVYKINLNKAHKIKAGVTVIDTKAYPTIGYQAGKVEGLLHFDGANVKGGSVLYTVKEW